VEKRIRAGILEQHSVDTLIEAGVGDRLQREGLEHRGIYLQYPGTRHKLDFKDLCGRTVWVYGQTEVVKDLIKAQLDGGPPLLFGVSDVVPEDVDTDHPRIRFTDAEGHPQVLECDVIAGTDGFHGVSRKVVADGTRQQVWERTYPYAWLGILADAAPATDELIYAWHPEGFALYSMRSPKVSRLYLQVDPSEKIEDWSDERIWDALDTRFALEGWSVNRGRVTDKSILPMRSFVSAPMRRGRLFLAGDAAHIVPPTGAKGLNLAVADVTRLATALVRLLQEKQTDLVDTYSDKALARVWRCTHFSWFMTSMLHRAGDDFDAQLQLSQLQRVCSSEAAARELAENYTGLPIEH
jgi:p-hydroxybenzoate 3-monooxygenase